MTRPVQELHKLLVAHAYEYRAEPFTLKSGEKSHQYVDCRRVLLEPDGRELASKLICAMIELKYADIDGIAGIPLGACPLIDQVSADLGLSAVYVRMDSAQHGTHGLIEYGWRLHKDHPARVVVLEDVTTTGGAVRRAVDILRQAKMRNGLGFEVRGAISIVDRGRGAVNELREVGIELASLYTLDQLAPPMSEI